MAFLLASVRNVLLLPHSGRACKAVTFILILIFIFVSSILLGRHYINGGKDVQLCFLFERRILYGDPVAVTRSRRT